MSKIKFAHTNIIAQDWKKLANFYVEVFGCKIVAPRRNMKGKWIDKLTNIKKVHIKGAHLQLPGYKNGPILKFLTTIKSRKEYTRLK